LTRIGGNERPNAAAAQLLTSDKFCPVVVNWSVTNCRARSSGPSKIFARKAMVFLSAPVDIEQPLLTTIPAYNNPKAHLLDLQREIHRSRDGASEIMYKESVNEDKLVGWECRIF
jgi:hypothetical protein